MNSFSPALVTQYDMLYKLKSEPYFDDANVVLQREKMLRTEVDVKTVCITPAPSGKCGLGIVIGMPVTRTDDSEAPGPTQVVEPVFTVLEQADINQGPNGSLIDAEDAANRLAQMLHQFYRRDKGTTYARGEYVVPNHSFHGIRAFDVTLWSRVAQDEESRVQQPTIEIAGSTVTLATPADAGAEIFYTVGDDPKEGFPGPGNPLATRYAAPFAVVDGDRLRFAGYKAGLSGSSTGYAVVTI